jgi:integrase
MQSSRGETIGHCIRCGAPLPDWVLNYLGRCAEPIEKIKIADIRSDDIKRVIRQAVDRGVIYQAFRDFALIRRLFNWAIGTDDYMGLEANTCRRLNPSGFIGQRYSCDRLLTDNELRALWRATGRFDYPYGPMYRLLLLTGLRLGEVFGASWSEFDLAREE